MKKETHKIPNVDESVCVREQMAAYNCAFAAHINFGDMYKENKDKAMEAILRIYLKAMDDSKVINAETFKKAFNNGIEKYMDNYFIASHYEQVGKAFPIN